MIVNHVAGKPVEVERGDGLTEWEQRCARCRRLLRSCMSILSCYDEGEVIQRGETHNAVGAVVRVQWSAIPMSPNRVGGKVVPDCEEK